jgi:superfamily II DNA helicase RecQ
MLKTRDAMFLILSFYRRVDLIYASPETLVGDPAWRASLTKLNVTAIVIDEFHTIATW